MGIAMTGTWARIPLRIKLTLAFTGVMAILLAAAGIALSVLVARNLDSAIDGGLKARAGDAAALVAGRGGPGRLDDSGEAIAQLQGPNGHVLRTTTRAGVAPLLTPQERLAASATTDGIIIDRKLGASHEEVRLLARAVHTMTGPKVLVIGESLAQRQQSLESLRA